MLKTFSLAVKSLWRECRAHEWSIVFIALVLAIAAITSIHFYTDRWTRAVELQSTKFLGGDFVISSSSPISRSWLQKAHALQLKTAEVWSYPTVVTANNKLQLVNMQAVSSNYPLFGDNTRHPQEHTVWVEQRLMPLLAIKLNDNITIGAQKISVAKILDVNQDTLYTGWIIAPRVLMSLADVPATHTVLPGSRVDFRLLITGDKSHIQQFQQWVKPKLLPGQLILSVHNQQFVLRDLLQRTENYLQLILLICLMISGVAIALSVQQFLRRHYAQIALWRCLGAKRRQIIHIFLWQLSIIAVLAGAIGIAIGYVAQGLFADLFKEFLQLKLPAPGLAPVLLGFATSSLLLFTFAYPVISQLPRTPPLFLWRNEIVKNSLRKNLSLIISLMIIWVFVYWSINFSLLIVYFLGALLVGIGFLYVLSLVLLSSFRILLRLFNGAIRRGISQLIHHQKSISLQFIGFTLILISLMVLSVLRTDLISNWQVTLTKETPNYFAINIASTDIPKFQEFFAQHQVPIEGIYPMIRGRLVALNGKPLFSAIPKAANDITALHRELNLSWMWKFPGDNKIAYGAPWTKKDEGKPLVSVENKLAKNMKLHLGDELTFQIGGKKLSAVIANFRQVEWTSFHPNFYMIFAPGLIDNFPTTYVTSFHLSPQQADLVNELNQNFPNISIIDVASLLFQMQDLIGKITVAMQYLFMFALGAGILMFVTSLQATLDERRQTYQLLRVLGAGRKYIYKSLAVEFGCLALVIFASSISLALLIAYLLERNVFNL